MLPNRKKKKTKINEVLQIFSTNKEKRKKECTRKR